MNRRCYALDLKDDPALIAGYDEWHKQVWPEVLDSIRGSGILSMEIYRAGNRLFMVMETDDSFDPAAKALQDASNPRVLEWETLMWNYQQAIPVAAPGEKWVLMQRIFVL
jgi:L-rhamnose mutarotase